MSKHFKSRFTSGQSTKSSSKSKVNIEFFQLLKIYLSNANAKIVLNMPETIIMNCPGCESVLFYTESDSIIAFKENITISVQRFLKRCYYFFKNPYPMLVMKVDKGNFADSCSSVASLRDAYAMWKKHTENPKYFCFQRFVTPANENLSKIRVAFFVQKAQMMYRYIFKKENAAPSPSPKRGWVRLKTVSGQVDPKEKYFVRGGDELGTFEQELRNHVLQEQMRNLKKIIEFSECSDGSFSLLEIYADFIQDSEGVWYFLNVVNYKIDFVGNKKPKTTLPKMRRSTKLSTKLIKPQTALTFQQSQLMHSLSNDQILMNEILRDLQTPIEKSLSTEIAYCKAHHLKLN